MFNAGVEPEVRERIARTPVKVGARTCDMESHNLQGLSYLFLIIWRLFRGFCDELFSEPSGESP